ncbi:hypothetical protein EF912_11950 [Streptomyces sp. WAC07061]|nr:hypothetical protein EF912_11950 [Streptomyces sp. WAC07061]
MVIAGSRRPGSERARAFPSVPSSLRFGPVPQGRSFVASLRATSGRIQCAGASRDAGHGGMAWDAASCPWRTSARATSVSSSSRTARTTT